MSACELDWPAIGSFAKDVLLIILAPIGIWLGARFQSKEKDKDRAHDKVRLLREKAEEIYDESEIIINKYTNEALERIAHLHGLRDEPPLPTLIVKLKSLLRMYFPDSEAIVSRYEAEYSRIGIQAEERQNLIRKLPQDEQAVAYRQAGYDNSKASKDVGFAMVSEVRKFMDQKVKELL